MELVSVIRAGSVQHVNTNVTVQANQLPLDATTEHPAMEAAYVRILAGEVIGVTNVPHTTTLQQQTAQLTATQQPPAVDTATVT